MPGYVGDQSVSAVFGGVCAAVNGPIWLGFTPVNGFFHICCSRTVFCGFERHLGAEKALYPFGSSRLAIRFGLTIQHLGDALFTLKA